MSAAVAKGERRITIDDEIGDTVEHVPADSPGGQEIPSPGRVGFGGNASRWGRISLDERLPGLIGLNNRKPLFV
jgi:hypothetical protein